MAPPFSVVRGGLVLAGILLIAVLLSLPSTARGDAACAGADAEPTGSNEAALAASVLCLLNEERAQRDLPALKSHRQLLKAATKHSSDMVRRRYFDHTSPDGTSMKDRAVAARYVPKRGAWRVAENLAWGSGELGSPRHVVASWMKSPPHRRNVLDGSLKHAGVGVVNASPDGGSGATFTLLLGRR